MTDDEWKQMIEGHWTWVLAEKIAPGDQIVSARITIDGLAVDTGNDEHIAAAFLHSKLGGLRDADLKPYQHFMVDWSDKSAPKPTLRLSPDLFAHVANACER